ncbi:MAG TPA: hypothetical protein VHJ54_01780 [Solirubrobacterales bacterium]|nr:hypothetical protein [Solirubrobacterales bacterium]
MKAEAAKRTRTGNRSGSSQFTPTRSCTSHGRKGQDQRLGARPQIDVLEQVV